jgi:ribosomal protein S18 acetylase RimI-like enzyme
LQTLSVERLTHRYRQAARRGNQAIWVAEQRGTVIGYVTFGQGDQEGFAGEIAMLYVSPEFQGHGVGAHLMRSALLGLEDAGFHWVHIWVVEKNAAARAFYEGHGLRADGARRVDVFHGVQVPVVRYARALNDDLLCSLDL